MPFLANAYFWTDSHFRDKSRIIHWNYGHGTSVKRQSAPQFDSTCMSTSLVTAKKKRVEGSPCGNLALIQIIILNCSLNSFIKSSINVYNINQGLSVACILSWNAHWCRKEYSIFACSSERIVVVQWKAERTLAASDVNGCNNSSFVFLFPNLASFFWSMNVNSLQLTFLHIP